MDGITTAASDRILVKNQSTAAENGVYVASAGAWALASDNPAGIGSSVPVQFGTTNAGTVWQHSTSTGWSQIGDAIRLATAGSTGLTLTPSSMTGGVLATRFSGLGNQTSTLTLAGLLAVGSGGTGATTLTGYVKGAGTSALTASSTIPSTDITGLAAVATSGAYADLSGTPTLNSLLPDQTGNAGKVLQTDGSAVTWETPSGGGSASNTYKEAVRVATTANATLASAFENGDTIDGVVLATGDRVLIKNQTTQSANGIYIVQATGSPVRATDFDTTGAQVANGAIIPVQYGTVNGGSTWQLVKNGGTIGNSFQFAPVNMVAYGGAEAGTANPVGPVASAARGIAIGFATASATPSVAIGSNGAGLRATASGVGSINIGSGYTAATGSVVIGDNVTSTGTPGNYVVILGYTSTSGNPAGARSVNVGSNNIAAQLGSIALGSYALAEFRGEIAHSTGGWADPNTTGVQDAKSSIVILRQATTNATVTEMGVNDGTIGSPGATFVVLQNDSTYLFDCDIVARNTASDTQSKVWNLKFGIRRGTAANTTTLIGVPTKVLYGEDSGTSAWDVNVTADTTNGRPNISVTGAAATTIRWVANIRMTKVAG
jgi:hypothetical protein